MLGPEELRAPEVGVHGALGVGGDDDEAAAGGRPVGGRRAVEGHAGGPEVVGEHGAELVVADPPDVGGPAPEAGDAGDGVGGRAARHLDAGGPSPRRAPRPARCRSGSWTPCTRPWASMKASSSWLRTSTRALPMPTTSTVAGSEVGRSRRAEATGRAGPLGSLRRWPTTPDPHRLPRDRHPRRYDLTLDPGSRRGHVRRRGRHRGRRARGHRHGGPQRHRARDPPGLGHGRATAASTPPCRSTRTPSACTSLLTRALAAGHGRGVAAVHRHPQRQAARLLPLHLHRRRRRRAGDRHHPVRGHRRPAGLPVLGRARLQGGLRRHPRGRPDGLAGRVQRRRGRPTRPADGPRRGRASPTRW